jgi:hypothetical protein
VVAHHPELLDGEPAEATGDLLHGELVVALYGEPGRPQTLPGVGEGLEGFVRQFKLAQVPGLRVVSTPPALREIRLSDTGATPPYKRGHL